MRISNMRKGTIMLSKDMFVDKPLQTGLGLLSALLALVSCIVYLVFAAGGSTVNGWLVILPLGVAFAAQLLTLFVRSDVLLLLGVAGISVALFAFISDSVQIFVGYFTNTAIFGDVSQIGLVFTLCVLMLVCALLSMIACFTKYSPPKV